MSIQSQTLINPKLIIRLEIRFYSYLHDLWLLQLPYSKNWNMIIFEDKTERNLLFTTPQYSEQPDDYSFTPTIRWFRLHNQIYIICTVSKFATSQRENKILYDRSSNNQFSLKKQLTSGQTVKLLSIMIMMRNIGASAFIKTDFSHERLSHYFAKGVINILWVTIYNIAISTRLLFCQKRQFDLSNKTGGRGLTDFIK